MYKLKRLFKMNYAQFFRTLKELRKVTKKSYLWLLLDILYCALKYEAGYIDYKVFEMYKYPEHVRSTFVTRGINNKIVKHCNDLSFRDIVADKIEFNKRFSNYLGRQWLDLRETTIEDFVHFCENKKYLFLKPVDQICGKGIEKIEVSKPEKLYDKIISKGIYLVEEEAVQHQSISKINNSSVNTLRLVTINNNGIIEILFGILRIGNGKFVDNLNQGGLAAPIDILTGRVRAKAASKDGEMHEFHPTSNAKIEGLLIPNYDKCIETVREAAKLVPELRYLGWDVYITEDGCGLIEANVFPGHDLYQLPGQLDNNQGVLPHFKKHIDIL